MAERLVFLLAGLLTLSAAVLAYGQLRTGRGWYGSASTHLVALAVVAEVVLLVLRALDQQGTPLAGLFESLLVLTAAFGGAYLVLGMLLKQGWFRAVMLALVFGMLCLTGWAAQPTRQVHEVVTRPWAIAHGLAMALSGAAILVGSGAAIVYLASRARLKKKELARVVGVMPNLQRLERTNSWALAAGFVLLTLGLVSGAVMAAVRSRSLGLGFADWAGDAKTVTILAAWALAALSLAGRRLRVCSGRVTAYMTLVVLVLLVLALACGLLWQSVHDFGMA